MEAKCGQRVVKNGIKEYYGGRNGIIYKVIINPGEEERFHIPWLNVEAGTQDSFDQSEKEITPEEIWQLWQYSRNQLDIGGKLFRLLDGDACHLQRALN